MGSTNAGWAAEDRQIHRLRFKSSPEYRGLATLETVEEPCGVESQDFARNVQTYPMSLPL
jgi:hypothetical protein